MFNSRLLLVTALLSCQAFGAVSMDEKRERVEYLEELASKAVSMNIDAYKRDLKYEELDLPLDARAMNEANLLAEKIRVQVQKAYEAALEEKTPNEAIADVKAAIEKDLDLISPDMREEIKKVAIDSLENINTNSLNSPLNLKNLESALIGDIKERAMFLNKEDDLLFNKSNSSNTQKSKIKDFKNKSEVISALISDRPGDELSYTTTATMKSTETIKSESAISLKVGVEFLGASIDAGPSINFKREFKTNVIIQADGLHPAVQNNGIFDFYKRDNKGNIVKKNGVAQKRLMNFSCYSSLDFETDYAGGGGFSFAGIGGSKSISKKYTNSVTLTSRRILVPESIGGKIVTLKDLANLCHHDFLNAKVSKTMTIAGSLNIMMKNVVSGLRFSHPKTKCLQDTQCYNWYNNEIIALARARNFPRCVEERKEKYRTCELRGLEGQNCSVYDSKGKRISDGSFEFTCDTGLKCVKTRNAGWFQGFEIYQYARGVCKPVNPKTYRSPMDQQPKYYEINFQR